VCTNIILFRKRSILGKTRRQNDRQTRRLTIRVAIAGEPILTLSVTDLRVSSESIERSSPQLTGQSQLHGPFNEQRAVDNKLSPVNVYSYQPAKLHWLSQLGSSSIVLLRYQQTLSCFTLTTFVVDSHCIVSPWRAIYWRWECQSFYSPLSRSSTVCRSFHIIPAAAAAFLFIRVC